MKKILAMLAILIVPMFVHADESASTASNVTVINLPFFGQTDVTNFITKSRVGIAYDIGDTDEYTDAHISVMSFHGSDGAELVNLNGGVIWRVSDGNSGGRISLGLRPGNIIDKLTSGDWWKTHTTKTVLGNVEVTVGPSFMALSGYKSKVEWKSIGFAVGF